MLTQKLALFSSSLVGNVFDFATPKGILAIQPQIANTIDDDHFVHRQSSRPISTRHSTRPTTSRPRNPFSQNDGLE